MSNKTISKWENGKCMPDYSIIEQVCRELSVTLSELMNGEDAAESSMRVYDDKQILDLLRRMRSWNGRKGFSTVSFSLSSALPATPCRPQPAAQRCGSSYPVF